MEEDCRNKFNFEESAHKIVEDMPSMVFLMDKFPMVVGMNSLAKEMSGIKEINFYQKRCGELFSCINSINRGSCGTTKACEDCSIRSIYREAQHTGNVVRKKIEMVQFRTDKEADIRQYMFTAYRIEALGGGATVLIADDISEFVQLKSFVHICSSCKKIKDEDQVWKTIEDFLHQKVETDFSHSLCPECFVREFKEKENQ
ncbi:MAG: hypothetical protein LWY06_07785 [Firmicutes bacterium]|nr:hypothetical protein [Bacillota bacterium]